MSEQQDVDGPPRTARRRSWDVPSDLTVYAALAGRVPDIVPTPADPVAAAALAVRANPWSPAVLGGYVRQVVRVRGVHLNRPEVAAWLRKQSAVARRRLAQTQARVTAAAFSVSAADRDDGED